MRALLLALAASVAAQGAAAQGEPLTTEQFREMEALRERVQSVDRGACDQGVPMPTLDLDRTPPPAPMPQAETPGTPVPMPNLCDAPLAAVETGPVPLTPEILDGLRRRVPPEMRERLRRFDADSLRERLDSLPPPYRFAPDALRPRHDDDTLRRHRFLRPRAVPPGTNRQRPVDPPDERP